MLLKSDHVQTLSGNGSRRHQNHVELGVQLGVVSRQRGSIRVEGVAQVETSDQTTVEVGSQTAAVAHVHVQNVVVLERGNREGAANVRRHGLHVAKIGSLADSPLRVVERSHVPLSGNGSVQLIELPVIEVDLEGDVRAEAVRGDGGLGVEVADVQTERSHIHRQ